MRLTLIQSISIFSIPGRIKTKRWNYWERRKLFADDKRTHGIQTAYRWAKGWLREYEER